MSVSENNKECVKGCWENYYSKKRLNGVINKYHICINRNKTFQSIVTVFKGKTDLQLWGIKMKFGENVPLAKLFSAYELSSENHSLIKLLSKKNLISYNTKDDLNNYFAEMDNLSKIAFMKKIISTFNTQQRSLFYIIADNFSQCSSSFIPSTVIQLYTVLTEFDKLPEQKKHNFIVKASAIENYYAFYDSLRDCIREKWGWNKEELVDYVKTLTDCSIIYNKENVVIVEIGSFQSCANICGGGKTSWCITRELIYWKQYISYKSSVCKQYAMFNFSLDECDDLAIIGYTIDSKCGMYIAQSTKNASILNDYYRNNEALNFTDIIKSFGLNLSDIIKLKPFNLTWDENTIFKELGIIKKPLYFKNKICVFETSSLDEEVVNKLLSHTYIEDAAYDSDSLLLLDFNRDINDPHSISIINVEKDEYQLKSFSIIRDSYNFSVKKSDFSSIYGILEEDILKESKDSADINLRKVVDCEDDEEKAIEIIEANKDKINPNFVINDRLTILVALQNGMYRVVDRLMSMKDFDYNSDDIYGEKIQTDIILLYTFLEADNDNDLAKFNKLISKIIDNCDLSQTNINDDTMLTCALTKVGDNNADTSWIVNELLNRKNININAVNDIDETALELAIMKEWGNEVIKKILSYDGFMLRDKDKELLKSHNPYLLLEMPNYFNDDADSSEKMVKKSSIFYTKSKHMVRKAKKPSIAH